MKEEEQILLFKRLSFLTNAGLSVLESFTTIKEQTQKKSHVKILDSIIHDISSGKKISDSMSKFPKVFSEFSVNIINSGEHSGTLGENLNYLTNELIKRKTLKKKIISAFVYPIIVSISTISITLFLVTYLFPKIIPVFKSMNIKLPFSTKIIIFISEMLKENGFYLFIFVFVLVAIFTYIIKTNKKFQYFFDYNSLKLPIIGKILKNYHIANSTRTTGLLLKSGLALSDTLFIVQRTTSSSTYMEEFKNLFIYTNNGEKISSYLKTKPGLFSNDMSQVISIGEKSGNLSESLLYISETYEAEVDEFTKNLSTLIEPVMMIIMGAIVGFIAISIISPIYSITQNLHG